MATMKPVADEVTDEEIVGQSIADPGAFGAIFERHFSAIYSYLARRVGSVVADDLASQTFMVAFDRRRSFHPQEGGALPWLYRIATNLLSNHRRSEQRLLEGIARLGEEPQHHRSFGSEIAEDQAMVNIELQQAAVLLAALEPHHRDVLLLHLWAGLSYDEIAVALDIPSGTVRSRLSRARQAIRDGVAEVPQPLHPHKTRRSHDR
jgi:RNA polymerase sigma-70 factor (ECF subfamily)